MAKERLPDTPWHIGYIKKDEDDPRRHKARCVYNDGKRCSHSRVVACCGSSHCRFYAETWDEAELYRKSMSTRNFRPFAGTVFARRGKAGGVDISQPECKSLGTYNAEKGKPEFFLIKRDEAEREAAVKDRVRRGYGICTKCKRFNRAKKVCSATGLYRDFVEKCPLYKNKHKNKHKNK